MSMDRVLLQSLERLRLRMGRAQAVLAQAMAAGAAIRDGTDPSGGITIILDDDGAAQDVRIAADWRQRLAPDEVGAAVVAADETAARCRAIQTTTALSPGASTADSTVDTVPQLPEWLQPVQPAGGPRRSLTELTAAAWAAFDDLGRVTVTPRPVRVSGADGALELVLSQGRITGCTVDAHWLTRQDDTTLSHALRAALNAARTQERHAAQPLRAYQRQLDDLLADAMATLHPRRDGVDDDASDQR
jgi:hypothetical protein